MNATSASPGGAGLSGAPPSSAGFMAQAVLDMLARAERAIEIDPRQARVFLDQASRLLEPAAEISPPPKRAATPGLAPWQERRILRHVGDHLHQPISNRDLADLARLSVGHFSRRFRDSFGVGPHEYVVRSRLERAKTLMRRTRLSLSQIALDTGFCDQAHMSRTFHAIVGSTPARWRREQSAEPAI